MVMKNKFRRRSILRLRLIAGFVITYSLIGIAWEQIEEGHISIWGPMIGASVGFALGILEDSKIAAFTRSLSFTAAILAKSVLYLSVIAIPVMILGLIGGTMEGKHLSEYFDWVFSLEFIGMLSLLYLIHLMVIFFLHLNQLLGPSTLLRYLTGTYHRPITENRVFMFLDLKSSTTLAETLGGEKYFAMLNTYFRDISEPILERGAEIYQYIGDEVVLTWPAERAFRDANCVRVFIEIMAEIHSKRHHYLKEFGHVPEFKAGLHFGKVITAEIGDLKKEIVYSGDVLNTTARIESMCNQYDHKLIASEELVKSLSLPQFITPVPLGQVSLRGKSESMPLIALA